MLWPLRSNDAVLLFAVPTVTSPVLLSVALVSSLSMPPVTLVPPL